MNHFVVISGCSGGGKSTLLAALSARGYAVVEEPGRRIVEDEAKGNGSALPWVNMTAFARRAVAMALEDRNAAGRYQGWVFFDRGLVDAAAALEHVTGEPALAKFCQAHRYHKRVFLVPPWPEIYVTDPERRHGLDAAVAEYDRLLRAYSLLGYDICILPKTGIAERADFVLQTLAADEPAL
ncbi:AAA family ATPase [Rhizobium sp. LjRoot98]|uniref:AAA family ATPase n=1 Tax=unclassified Rhizobium TaxID=2613769 RepID=UPI0007132C63|nr:MULTISPECIES: AAA family ATPase [unclassified Rhizobium]KQV37342.1 ATPase [Rhizobium sp. Root1204]KQY17355.1 ATPase [Rhizobium sp. Root1334]KRC13239.1 ATPase [Rhizobium sp. Root73]